MGTELTEYKSYLSGCKDGNHCAKIYINKVPENVHTITFMDLLEDSGNYMTDCIQDLICEYEEYPDVLCREMYMSAFRVSFITYVKDNSRLNITD